MSASHERPASGTEWAIPRDVAELACRPWTAPIDGSAGAAVQWHAAPASRPNDR